MKRDTGTTASLSNNHKVSTFATLSQEDHLYTGRGMAHEHGLVDHMFGILLVNEAARERQDVEQKDEGHGEDEDEGPQQEMNMVAPQ
jgi:hypothetical protein